MGAMTESMLGPIPLSPRAFDIYRECCDLAPDFKLEEREVGGKRCYVWSFHVDGNEYASAVEVTMSASVMTGFMLQAQGSIEEVLARKANPSLDTSQKAVAKRCAERALTRARKGYA
jgi:hypothetical protein